jgi:hypothetical protein
MRLYEFVTNGVMDVDKHTCIGLEKALMKISLRTKSFIYEDHKDVKDYKTFMAGEKQHTIPYSDLVKGQTYFPVSYRGSPFQQTIYINRPSVDVKFVSIDGVDLIFKNINELIKLRISKENALGTLETFIFKNKSDAEQHLITLKLKFNGWYIPIVTI